MTRSARLGPALALFAAYGLVLVTLVGSLRGLVLAAAATYGVETGLLWRPDTALQARLNRVGAGIAWRFFFRQVVIVGVLARSGKLTPAQLAVVVVCVVGHHCAVAIHTGLRVVVNARRLRRLETRNLAVPGEALPPPPPGWLFRRGAWLILSTDLFLLAGLAVGAFGGSFDVVPLAAVVTVVAALALSLGLTPAVVRLRRLPSDELRMAAAQQAVDALQPLVILYFSGGRTSVYQVNMWLEVMERLDRRVLILLRERRYLGDVPETSVPILCLPFSVDLMNFPIPSARVSLYVANVGKNIHLLREPTLQSAFIGHGDSDKTASFNPFAKVYDEVWVAGEAGRQRYLRAQVGVRQEEIVLVGRPQLDAVTPAQADRDGQPFTVLYAPTWEGWTEDPHQSSLIPMGHEIVQLLLSDPGVRVLYKPHPLTGKVNPDATRIDAEIRALLQAAGPHHMAVTTTTPLYECFNDSDALISDISSVVSDYLKSEKPYFVTNGAAISEAQFRRMNPAAAGAYLVGPAASGLGEGMAAARGSDPMRAAREATRIYLLGDPDKDAMTLMRCAIDRLAAKAERYTAPSASAAGDDDEMTQLREGEPESRQALLTDAGDGEV
ncbi:MAG: CDP-glycerol glycerophosphotransferase family protein [bacterium]